MTSIIPYFILLLTAYAFSAPVGQENENSTIGWELTTGQANISTDSWWNGQSTGLPIVQKPRSVEDSNSNEVTIDNVSRPPRAWQTPSNFSSNKITNKRGNDYSFGSQESASSEKRESQESFIPTSSSGYKKRNNEASQESLESNEKRESQESAIPTSSSGYKKRSNEASQESFESGSNEKRDSQESVVPTSSSGYKKRSDAESQESFESASNEKRDSKEYPIPKSNNVYKKNAGKSYLYSTLESSTVFNRRAIRPMESQDELESGNSAPEQQMPMNTDVKPSSSVDSFGKSTGLLDNQQVDRSSEESRSPVPVQTQKKITKTVSIVPGKVTKTKVITDLPSKSADMMQPIQQDQLSQGQSQSDS